MKKILFFLLHSKIFFFLLCSVIILSLNLTPLITLWNHSPAGRTFVLVHNNAQDFFFYQALMNEGANRSWLTTDPYTTEVHKPSIIFAYFVWLGKLSHLLGLPYSISYHLIRIILSVFFLLASYILILSLNLPYPRLAFLFFVFAAPFMHQIVEWGQIRTVPYMYWWTGMDPVRRAAYLPHHMFGGLFLIISILLIIRYYYSQKKCCLIGLIFVSFLLAFFHTPSLFIILLFLTATIFIFLIPDLVSNKIFTKLDDLKKNNFLRNSLAGFIVFWIIGFLFLTFMVSQTNRGFPWSQYLSWEKKLQFPLAKELIGAFGILFPLAFIGFFRALFSRRFSYILIACWFVVPFLLIPFAARLSISNIRLIQGVPYLPLAILAVMGIKKIENIAIKILPLPFLLPKTIRNQSKSSQETKLKETNSKHNFNPNKLSGTLFSKCLIQFFNSRPFKKEAKNFNSEAFIIWITKISIIIIFTVFTFPNIKWSVKDQIREYWPIFGNIYLDNRLYHAFSFINSYFPAKSHALATFYTGNYLPAFTHTISFIGHTGYTYNITEKEKAVGNFFANKMTEKEAKDFLLSNKIDLIFQGPEEKPIYNNYLYPQLLKPIYDKEEVTIYILK